MKRSPLCFLRKPALALLLSTSLFSSFSQAGIMLGGTRIVYDGNKRDASITVSNITGQPYAVQAWVNTESDDNTTSTPFVAMPPLFRLDPHKEQILRIQKVPGALPEDRESVFYLNAQEIPVTNLEDENTLKVAIRSAVRAVLPVRQAPGSSSNTLPTALEFWSTSKARPSYRINNPFPLSMCFLDSASSWFPLSSR
ncbi:fimbrial biogenesis chaperone [Pseudomonas chlororaphis]